MSAAASPTKPTSLPQLRSSPQPPSVGKSPQHSARQAQQSPQFCTNRATTRRQTPLLEGPVALLPSTGGARGVSPTTADVNRRLSSETGVTSLPLATTTTTSSMPTSRRSSTQQKKVFKSVLDGDEGLMAASHENYRRFSVSQEVVFTPRQQLVVGGGGASSGPASSFSPPKRNHFQPMHAGRRAGGGGDDDDCEGPVSPLIPEGDGNKVHQGDSGSGRNSRGGGLPSFPEQALASSLSSSQQMGVKSGSISPAQRRRSGCDNATGLQQESPALSQSPTTTPSNAQSTQSTSGGKKARRFHSLLDEVKAEEEQRVAKEQEEERAQRGRCSFQGKWSEQPFASRSPVSILQGSSNNNSRQASPCAEHDPNHNTDDLLSYSGRSGGSVVDVVPTHLTPTSGAAPNNNSFSNNSDQFLSPPSARMKQPSFHRRRSSPSGGGGAAVEHQTGASPSPAQHSSSQRNSDSVESFSNNTSLSGQVTKDGVLLRPQPDQQTNQLIVPFPPSSSSNNQSCDSSLQLGSGSPSPSCRLSSPPVLSATVGSDSSQQHQPQGGEPDSPHLAQYKFPLALQSNQALTESPAELPLLNGQQQFLSPTVSPSNTAAGGSSSARTHQRRVSFNFGSGST